MADPIRPPSSVLRPQSAVDADNPWPGLASFTEETKSFFHGRDQEVTELFRRVQRKLLTILFGQSGHGKSSLLRAGLVPKLRPEGYCPIYVRLDHTPGSMSLSEQIKEAVFRVTAAAGTWTKPGASVAGESLWEFLHHRDDLLKDADGRTLVPLIIFDQFEEIFTLAQTDATGRARADAFVAELADLVENRPPVALEERLNENETDADRFDFTRSDYRILITLREDYLPHLEALKKRMPSITQNRLRLSRLSGKQALESVLKTGGNLVTPEVAEAIVKFVSGAEEIAHAEVEPSLLSLVCRELNETRKRQGAGGKGQGAGGQSTITADLLAGSRESILNEYYERTLADYPVAIREFIEDELLTTSGFRESVGEERVAKAIAAGGAPADTLAALVNQRLLRIEERLDVRRVELTHDVLCAVVKASRDTRLQRLALRKARRLRYVVGGLAAGLALLVTGAIAFGIQNQKAALEAARRSSRSDFTFGSQALEEGKVSEGLAYLARAAETDPENHLVGPRLISALVSRAFTQPVGISYSDSASTLILGFSKDGTRVVTAADDNTLSFWNVQTGQRVVEPVSLSAQRLSFSMSADGSRVAVALIDNTMGIWEVATGRKLAGPLPTGANPICVSFSPDGRWLASGTQTTPNAPAQVLLWDAATGERIRTLRMRDVGWVGSVNFSPDSTKLLATNFSGGLWKIWSVPSGELLTPDVQSIPGIATGARYGRFSPDGRLVLISDQAGAQLWDWASQTRVGQRMTHDQNVEYAEFSPDGSWVLTASLDRTTRVWRVPSGLPFGRFEFSQSSRPTSRSEIAGRISRDGRRFLTVDETKGVVYLLDAVSGRQLIEPIRSAFFNNARFSPDEKEIWTGARDGSIRRWSASASAAIPLEIYMDAQQLVPVFPLEPDKLMLRTRQGWRVIDRATGAEAAPPQVAPARIRSATTFAEKSIHAVLTTQGTAELWDFRNPDSPVRYPLAPLLNAGRNAPVALFTFSPTGDRLAQIDLPETGATRVTIWDTNSGERLGEFETGGIRNNGTRLAFSPSRDRIAIGDNAGNMGVFDISSGKQLGETVRHGIQISGIVFSPDGTQIASTGTSKMAYLTDAATGRNLLPPLRLPSIGAGAPRFSPDGRQVMLRVGTVGQVVFWDTRTGATRALLLPNALGESYGAAGPVDPESSLVAGRYNVPNSEIRIVSLATGQTVFEPTKASAPTPTGGNAMAFSSDARSVAARLDGRNTLYVWPLPEIERNSDVPAWIPRLAKTVAGGRINPTGAYEPVPTIPAEFAAIKAELAALPADAPYVKWGRWFLDDPTTRTINPETTLTRAQAAQMADNDPLAALKGAGSRLRVDANWLEAEAIHRQILLRLRDGGNSSTADISQELTNLAACLVGQGRYSEAETTVRESLGIRERLGLTDELGEIASYLTLGEALAGQRRNEDAEAALLAAFAAYKSNAVVPVQINNTVTALIRLYRDTNRPNDAAFWQARTNGNVDIGR